MGCAPMATRKTTEPAGRGHFQGSLGIDGLLFRDTEQQVTTPGAMVDVGARYGIADDLDVGLRLYNLGVEGSAKWRFVRGGFAAAVSPAVSVARTNATQITTKATYVFADLPLILGSRLTESLTLDYGPKCVYGMYRPANGGAAHGFLLGAFVNLDVRMGRGFHFLPEIDVYGSVTGEVPVHGWIANGGLGLLKDF